MAWFLGKIDELFERPILGILTFFYSFIWIMTFGWLLVLNERISVLWGPVVTILFFYSVLILVFILTFLLKRPSLIFLKKGNKFLAVLFGFLKYLFTNLVLALGAFYIFWLFVIDTPIQHTPSLVLWAYAILSAPLAYLAKPEGPEVKLTWGSVFFVQFAYLAVVYLAFNKTPINDLILILAIFAAAVSIYQSGRFFYVLKHETRKIS